MHRDFKGVWIPREIWLIPNLKPVYRVFLAEIDSLDNGSGCYAKNEHFAKMFGLSKNRCSEILTMLSERGFIRVEYRETPNEDEGRIISVYGIVEKSTAPVEKSTVPVEKSTTYIGIEIHLDIHNNINNIQFSFKDCSKILKNQINIEAASRGSKLSMDDVTELIPAFITYNAGLDKLFNSRAHYLHSFRNWISNYSVKGMDISKEFDWFIETFNRISGKGYLKTKRIEDLFKIQLNQGFTGNQMLLGIKNLYDSRNVWHKKQSYAEATPEFLLTGDRLNKFLNVKY